MSEQASGGQGAGGVRDEATGVRSGEGLDLDRLGPYLEAHLDGVQGPIEIRQFPRGHSNLTYLLRAGDRELVLRRPPFGSKVKTAHDMGREFRILSRLSAVYPAAPRPLHLCEDESVLGAPFYVMQRIEGLILRKDLPRGLTMSPEQIRALHLGLVDTQAELHGLDLAAAGLADLGKPEGYVERQVTGWTKRYEGSKTDDLPVVERVASWLASHLPASQGAALIHNDFKLDNVVLSPDDPTKIIGVLDWEMATLGDPLMDLGTSLAYWVNTADDEVRQAVRWGPTTVPGSLTRAEIVERYAARTGRDLGQIAFYYAFGLFKNAVVLQQIYYRYRQGLTKDERFAQLGIPINILMNMADEAIQQGKI
jgi:aminoglycoside phosphotransferase (APT) family kinase protein